MALEIISHIFTIDEFLKSLFKKNYDNLNLLKLHEVHGAHYLHYVIDKMCPKVKLVDQSRVASMGRVPDSTPSLPTLRPLFGCL